MHSRGSADHVENTASSFLWILNDTSLLWFHVKLQHLWILEVCANTLDSFLHGNFHMDHHNKSSDVFQQPTNLETSRNPDLHRLLHDSGTGPNTHNLFSWVSTDTYEDICSNGTFLKSKEISTFRVKLKPSSTPWTPWLFWLLTNSFSFNAGPFDDRTKDWMCVKIKELQFLGRKPMGFECWEIWRHVKQTKGPSVEQQNQLEHLQGWESKRESRMTMKTPYSFRGPFHLVAVFLGTNFGLKKPMVLKEFRFLLAVHVFTFLKY